MADIELSDSFKDESINENSLFIEMVKNCVECSQTLPILRLSSKGAVKIQTLQENLSSVSREDLQVQLEKMLRYTLLSKHNECADSFQITDLGREFKDILVDIEKLKEKYN